MTPHKLSDLEVAFCVSAKKLMPPMSAIPESFKKDSSSSKWIKFQSDWFFRGIKGLKIKSKDGIDKADALRHLQAIQGSFDCQHEHKQAAIAYLASLWFEDVEYEKAR